MEKSNLPFAFPQMQFSFCTIMNMCIFKFATLAHVLQTDVKPCVTRFDVWDFSILYASVNESPWVLQQGKIVD